MKKDFPIFDKRPNLIYLDSAATSLKPMSVIKAVSDYYTNISANVHRGVYELSHEATNLFEETREEIASFINCSSKEVIFTRGTTDGLNMFALSYGLDFINEGDEIITSEAEHHSSFMPWLNIAKKKKAKLVFIPLSKEGRVTTENFLKVLSSKTKVVAISHVSNVLGYISPIKEICKIANEHNIVSVIDGAQAIPHLSVNVRDLGCSIYAFSGHKMLGPTGIGVLYGKESILNLIDPVSFGGDMADIVEKDNASYKDAPYKFESGTPNIAGVLGLKEAVKYLSALDLDVVHQEEINLAKQLQEGLMQLEGVTVYNKLTDGGIVTFNIDGVHPHDVVSILDSKGIALRAGSHCAQLVHDYLGTPATLRASFYIYNTNRDVQKLIQALTEIIAFFKQF